MSIANQTICNADMISGCPNYDFGKKIIQVILKDGQMNMFDYREIVNDETAANHMGHLLLKSSHEA